MTKYSATEIFLAAKMAGFSPDRNGKPWSPAEIITAVALAESSGDSNATALTSRENSIGIYQINLFAHPEVSEQCARDITCASGVAFRLSSNGTNFQPWTEFKNGGYLRYLPLAGTPLPASPGGDNPPGNGGGNGGQNVGGGTHTETPADILGISLPTPDEWKRAFVALGVLGIGFALILIAAQNFGRGVGQTTVVPVLKQSGILPKGKAA